MENCTVCGKAKETAEYLEGQDGLESAEVCTNEDCVMMGVTYQIGQTVLVRGGFGTEAPKAVKIIDFGEKNGRPLFDYDTGGQYGKRWAYLNQIVGVRS